MTDQQLADRFDATELPAWENDQAFHQLLASLESILPLRQPFRVPRSKSSSADSQYDRRGPGAHLPPHREGRYRGHSFRSGTHRTRFPYRRSSGRVVDLDHGPTQPPGRRKMSRLSHPRRLPRRPGPFPMSCSLPGCCAWPPPMPFHFLTCWMACSQAIREARSRATARLFGSTSHSAGAIALRPRASGHSSQARSRLPRAPAQPRVLLRFSNPLGTHRGAALRVRYGFCPQCLAEQRSLTFDGIGVSRH